MGWGSNGRRALFRHRSAVVPRSPLFPLWANQSCPPHPAASCLREPNGLASSPLFSFALSRFRSRCPGVCNFAREMSSLGSTGSAGGIPGAWGGKAKSVHGEKSGSCVVNPAEVTEIVELVRGDGDDMESRLNQIKPQLSRPLVAEVLLALNNHGVSALRFFDWVVKTEPGFRVDSGVYNLIVDNLGRLHDYGRMLVMLRELSRGGHSLTEKAFKFLAFSSSVAAKDSVRKVVEGLNMAGGSCRASGIYSLIKLLCGLGSFELAVFVMEETARKTSYYNVLIAAKCRSGNFQDAYYLFDEMRKWGCDPSTKSYNYLLGSLCKNDKFAEACELLESMEELGYCPDSVTFEVVIFHACRLKRMDFAVEFLGRMLSDGIEPRFTTHAAFIKGYFWSGRAVDAHKYVVDMSERDKCSANMNYSLLASLFLKSGRIIEAGRFLFEMMEKNLKPNFSVYVKVTKDLHKLGRGDLASGLKQRFLKFHASTGVN